MSQVDVESTDISFNLTTTDSQLTNKGLPWRGRREKHCHSMQVSSKLKLNRAA